MPREATSNLLTRADSELTGTNRLRVIRDISQPGSQQGQQIFAEGLNGGNISCCQGPCVLVEEVMINIYKLRDQTGATTVGNHVFRIKSQEEF